MLGDHAPIIISIHALRVEGDGNSPADKKRKLTKALLSAGCTYPQITDASDLDSLHFAFECECVDGEAVEAQNGEI